MERIHEVRENLCYHWFNREGQGALEPVHFPSFTLKESTLIIITKHLYMEGASLCYLTHTDLLGRERINPIEAALAWLAHLVEQSSYL